MHRSKAGINPAANRAGGREQGAVKMQEASRERAGEDEGTLLRGGMETEPSKEILLGRTTAKGAQSKNPADRGPKQQDQE